MSKPIHPPKLISSASGLGLPNTIKNRTVISPTKIETSELWQEMEKPWAESGVIIANPGYTWKTTWEAEKNFIITHFYNEKGALVGTYCDICSPIIALEGEFAFYDWYLDVWQEAGKPPVILDENELQEAEIAGFISTTDAATARKVAQQLVEMLYNLP